MFFFILQNYKHLFLALETLCLSGHSSQHCQGRFTVDVHLNLPCYWSLICLLIVLQRPLIGGEEAMRRHIWSFSLFTWMCCMSAQPVNTSAAYCILRGRQLAAKNAFFTPANRKSKRGLTQIFPRGVCKGSLELKTAHTLVQLHMTLLCLDQSGCSVVYPWFWCG